MNLVFTSSVCATAVSTPVLSPSPTRREGKEQQDGIKTHLLLAYHANLAAPALPLERLDPVAQLVAERPVLVDEVLQLLVVALDSRIVRRVHQACVQLLNLRDVVVVLLDRVLDALDLHAGKADSTPGSAASREETGTRSAATVTATHLAVQ